MIGLLKTLEIRVAARGDATVEKRGRQAGAGDANFQSASTGKTRSTPPAESRIDEAKASARPIAAGGFAPRSLKLTGESLDELSLLHDFFDGLGRDAAWPERLKLDLLLCCEELLTNTISYGYPGERSSITRNIEATVTQEDECVVIELTDNALPYNPLLNKAPVLTLDVDDRPIGGLGVYFVKQIADEMHYEATETGNKLILRKRLGYAQEES